MSGWFFYGVRMLPSRPTPFSRLLRQAEDTMDLFYPRSIGVSVCNTFLQLAVIGRKSENFNKKLNKHLILRCFNIENQTRLYYNFIFILNNLEFFIK